MQTIHLYGAKGGAGTSTVAALVALTAADNGHAVALQDASGDHGDMYAILGQTASDDYPRVGRADGPISLAVIDHGTTAPAGQADGDRTYLVTRACYLALRRTGGTTADGVIFLAEAGRALDGRDIEAVTGVGIVATVTVDQTTARLIDAGMLGTDRRRPSIDLRATRAVVSA
jgi:hypothetical protein